MEQTSTENEYDKQSRSVVCVLCAHEREGQVECKIKMICSREIRIIIIQMFVFHFQGSFISPCRTEKMFVGTIFFFYL